MWDLPTSPSFRVFMQTPAFLELPAMFPPKGVIANFENPDNLRNPALAILQLLVVTLAVSIRLYTKSFLVKRTLAEDYWLYLSWVIFVGFHVLVFQAEDLPLGVHQYDMKVGHALKHAKVFFIGAGVYALLMLILKIAVILQIRRFFIPHQHTPGFGTYHRYLRWCVHITLAANVMYYLPIFIYHWCICRPVQRSWDPRVPGSCVSNDQVYYIISGTLNTASDLVIILVPQPLIWSLRVDRRKKLSLSVVFGLGGLALGASIARLYYAIQMYHLKDKTYYAALMGKWAEPELTFGFLAICLPVMPTFVKRIRKTAVSLRTHPAWTSNFAKESDRSAPVPDPANNTIRVHWGDWSCTTPTEIELDIELRVMETANLRKDVCWTDKSIREKEQGGEIAIFRDVEAQI